MGYAKRGMIPVMALLLAGCAEDFGALAPAGVEAPAGTAAAAPPATAFTGRTGVETPAVDPLSYTEIGLFGDPLPGPGPAPAPGSSDRDADLTAIVANLRQASRDLGIQIVLSTELVDMLREPSAAAPASRTMAGIAELCAAGRLYCYYVRDFNTLAVYETP